MAWAWERRKVAQVSLVRCGAGSMPASFSFAVTRTDEVIGTRNVAERSLTKTVVHECEHAA